MKRSEREENIKDEEKKKKNKTKKIGLDRAAARRGRRSLVPKEEKIKSPARSGLTASDPPSSKGLTSPIASLRIISRDSPVFFSSSSSS